MNFDKKQQIFTYELNGTTLTINADDGITAVALLLVSGAGSYRGTKVINGVNSQAVPLALATPVTITPEQTKYIDELLIDASSGIIQVIAR